MNLNTVTDEHRIDPANATRWWVRVGGTFAIVVATCKEEARLLGLLWIANAQGKTSVHLDQHHNCTVRPATDDDVERWQALRAQTLESVKRVVA